MNDKARRALPLLPMDTRQAASEVMAYCSVDRDPFLAERMRQRAAIQCFEVDCALVWATAKKEIPILLARLDETRIDPESDQEQ